MVSRMAVLLPNPNPGSNAMVPTRVLLRRRAVLLGALLLLLLVVVQRAWALATEHFGNAPAQWSFPDVLRAVADLKDRVYWYEVNGDPHFFYVGNTEALNEALAKFAAVKSAVREVILLPGTTERRNLTQDRRIPYDWEFHWPS